MPDSWPGLREELKTAAQHGTGRDPVTVEPEVVPVKATGLAGGPIGRDTPAPARDLMREANDALRAQVRQARARRYND